MSIYTAQTLKTKLIASAPEELQVAWSASQMPRPTCFWEEGGPSVEVGMALIKGRDSYGTASLVQRFNNPDVLDAIARKDKRIMVNNALIQNGNLSMDGYRAALKTLGDRFIPFPETFPHGFKAACELGHPDAHAALRVDVKKDGLIAALELCFGLAREAFDKEDPRAVRQFLVSASSLMSWLSESGHTSVGVTPEELLEGFIYYLKEFGEVVPLCSPHTAMPTLPERHGWLKEAPDAYERILVALLDMPKAVARQALATGMVHNFLPAPVKHNENPYPGISFSGPIPDFSAFTSDGPSSSQTHVNHACLTILDVWSRSVPLNAHQVRMVEELQYSRRTNHVFVAEAAAIVDGGALRGTYVAGDIVSALRDLFESSATVDEKVSSAAGLLALPMHTHRYGGPFKLAPGMQELVDQFHDLLPAANADTAARAVLDLNKSNSFLVSECYSDVLVRSVFEETSRLTRTLAEETLGWTNAELHSRILQKLREGGLSDVVFVKAWFIYHDLYDAPIDSEVVESSFPQLLRVLGQTLQGEHPDVDATLLLKGAALAAAERLNHGDSSKSGELIQALVNVSPDILTGHSRLNRWMADSILDRILATKEGVLSGLFPVVNRLNDPGYSEALSAIFTERFGTSQAKWEVALELIEDWEGSIQELLDVVDISA